LNLQKDTPLVRRKIIDYYPQLIASIVRVTISCSCEALSQQTSCQIAKQSQGLRRSTSLPSF